MKTLSRFTASALAVAASVLAQSAPRDPGASGPALEQVFVYDDQWPTGIAVSSTGRLFSNYPLGLDPANTRYQVAELNPSNNTQTPFPSVEINTPPGGAIDNSTYPPVAKGLSDYLIGVQSVVIDAHDRLWILDTGRVQTSNGMFLAATYGGPKLVGVDLRNNSVFQTILFPTNVAFADSYFNDVRFDLRPNITKSGQGVAYITDSSPEGRNGIAVVDLGTGESWRHLDSVPEVRAERGFFASVWGEPVYSNSGSPQQPISTLTYGVDGIALSADSETLYFCAVSTRYLFSVPTARLRDRSPSSELFAAASVMNLAQKGVSDGLESDSNGIVYGGSVETNSIFAYHPTNGTVTTFVRDPRIGWSDTFSVVTLNSSSTNSSSSSTPSYSDSDSNSTSSTSYLYFTQNQVWRSPGQQAGIDRREKPYFLYRVPLLGNGTKIGI